MSRKSTKVQNQNTRQIPAILTRKRKVEECEQHSNTEVGPVYKRRSCLQITPEEDHCTGNRCMLTKDVINLSTKDNDLMTRTWRGQQLTCFASPPPSRVSPLPVLDWADHNEVWEIMVEKDGIYHRDYQLLNRHPSLQARMRAILLDWLIEVCEVYRLHRETYYLAMDFIDRYLASQRNIPKQQLQLIGITALFIAAKIEEIYPPKLSEFSYVTDGACTDNEILQQELIILKCLKWNLTPVTVNNWLNIYMQLSNMENIKDVKENFVFPKYSGHEFVQVIQLIDLCTLDIECLQFPYRSLAASALYHMTSSEVFRKVTGLQWDDVHGCINWLTPFAMAVREVGLADLRFFHQMNVDEMHNIQTHAIDLQLLDKAQAKQKQILLSSSTQSSPVSVVGMLTPPKSKEKCYTCES